MAIVACHVGDFRRRGLDMVLVWTQGNSGTRAWPPVCWPDPMIGLWLSFNLGTDQGLALWGLLSGKGAPTYG